MKEEENRPVKRKKGRKRQMLKMRKGKCRNLTPTIKVKTRD
jgi:hypothetical protein